MHNFLKYVGKCLFVTFLISCTLQSAYAATQDRGGAVGAGAEKTFSISDVWGGITDTFSSVLTPSPKDSAEKTSNEGDQKLIHAKKLADDVKVKEKEISAPYKVYQTPMIADEKPSSEEDSYSSTGAGSFSGWEPERVVSPKEPDGAIPSVEIMPPVSALPKQFFPIFALNAATDGDAMFLPVASNNELEADHSKVIRAIIYIHDITRNASESLATLMTLGGSDGMKTLVLAPQFPLDVDVQRFAQYLPEKGRNIACWPLEKGWSEGGQSLARKGQQGISSFTALDLLALFLGDRRRFPIIRDVILVGHGMGADFVQRYAAAGQAPDLLLRDSVTMRFVVANPSSYLYFTNQRPSQKSLAFTLPKGDACEGGNAYPYGLDKLVPYARHKGGGAIRLRYPERQVAYLVGGKIKSDNYLDTSCPAMLQGKDRLSRANSYQRHLTQSFGQDATQHSFTTIKNAGYDPVAIFGSSCGLTALFGNGACK